MNTDNNYFGHINIFNKKQLYRKYYCLTTWPRCHKVGKIGSIIPLKLQTNMKFQFLHVLMRNKINLKRYLRMYTLIGSCPHELQKRKMKGSTNIRLTTSWKSSNILSIVIKYYLIFLLISTIEWIPNLEDSTFASIVPQ